jgi:DNA segregation ATPase FtsK/SpoIIIE-like protein
MKPGHALDVETALETVIKIARCQQSLSASVHLAVLLSSPSPFIDTEHLIMHTPISVLASIEPIIHIVALVKDLAQRISTIIRTHLPIEAPTRMLATYSHQLFTWVLTRKLFHYNTVASLAARSAARHRSRDAFSTARYRRTGVCLSAGN